METEEGKKVVRGAIEAFLKSRRHAGSFGYPLDRDLEEYGVTLFFCETLKKEGKSFIDGNSILSRGRGNDPPDCEAHDLDGNLIGIEVTELVDSQAIIEAKKNKTYELPEWDKPKLIDAINNRLDKKDVPDRIKGGPYASYILIIHTDEDNLTIDVAKTLLHEHHFVKRTLIDRAFLFIFYDPEYMTYPYIEIEFKTN